jgi:hypothetical protein
MTTNLSRIMNNELYRAIDSMTDEQRQTLIDEYGIEPKLERNPLSDAEKFRQQIREVNVPKVYMLREKYEQIDPNIIHQKEIENCCIIVPVEEAELQRIREQAVVYTAPPPMPKIPDVFLHDPVTYNSSGKPGGNKTPKIEPKDYCKKKRAKRRAQKQARRKSRR